MGEQEVQAKDKRPLMRNRKGWIGFVHGYKDWLEACDKGVWDAVKWNEDPKSSGAKEVVEEGSKTIYTF